MGMRSSSLSCCSNKTLVQDQVCTDWSITGAGTQIVYTNNITQSIWFRLREVYEVPSRLQLIFSRCNSG